MRSRDPITLFLCGDVMTGRGIDQILPHPVDPALYESYVRSAIDYVRLAEMAHGPIPRGADFAYVWGDALDELRQRRPDVRIVNLESSITTSAEPFPKGINYRMSPRNVPVLTAAGIDCCVLANNHVLDWRRSGLVETLEKLAETGIRYAGAGRDLSHARAPAVLQAPGGGRVLVFAFGTPSAGIPPEWAAGRATAGVSLLETLSEESLRGVAADVAAWKRPGDVVVASIHWGVNWGYDIPVEQTRFARALIERAGVDVVHGHSSHHVKGIEVHQGKLILYGCGDFLTDYEGISGHEAFRGDLALMYFPELDPASGRLVRMRMVPLQVRHFRLNRAAAQAAAWLRDVLDREGAALGTSADLVGSREIGLRWS